MMLVALTLIFAATTCVCAATSEDLDQDGLTEAEEIANSTDPMDADSDDDGLSDGDEVYLYSLSPLDPDSDSDGLNDGLELGRTAPIVRNLPYEGTAPGWVGDADPASTTDPGDADTDDDGLCDGQSMASGCLSGEDSDSDGIVDAGETSPYDADTDDDGLRDGDEAALGLDPLDPDSDSDGLNDGLELGRSEAQPH